MMNIGEAVQLTYCAKTYKFRKEEDGYYCCLPHDGNIVGFNDVGFEIITLLADGYKPERIANQLVDKYEVGRDFWDKHLPRYFDYLKSLRIL